MSEDKKIKVAPATYTVELTDEEMRALSVLISHVTYKTKNPFYDIAKEISYILPEPDAHTLKFEVWDDHWEESEYRRNVEIEFPEDWNT